MSESPPAFDSPRVSKRRAWVLGVLFCVALGAALWVDLTISFFDLDRGLMIGGVLMLATITVGTGSTLPRIVTFVTRDPSGGAVFRWTAISFPLWGLVMVPCAFAGFGVMPAMAVALFLWILWQPTSASIGLLPFSALCAGWAAAFGVHLASMYLTPNERWIATSLVIGGGGWCAAMYGFLGRRARSDRRKLDEMPHGCPVCRYTLRDLPENDQHHTTCPECGAVSQLGSEGRIVVPLASKNATPTR